MGGRVELRYSYDSQFGDSGMHLVAWREGADLTPERVLPRLFGFASWLLPKPKERDRLEELEMRIDSLERQFPGSGLDPTIYGIALRALNSGKPAWR